MALRALGVGLLMVCMVAPDAGAQEDENLRFYQQMRVYLVDTALARVAGHSPDGITEQLISSLLGDPPVVNKPGESIACSAVHCALMLREATEHGGNQRLQAIGITAGLVNAPRVWVDSVLRYAEENPHLKVVQQFVNGYWSSEGLYGRPSAHPVPAPDAPVALWREWGGRWVNATFRFATAYLAFREVQTGQPYRRTFEQRFRQLPRGADRTLFLNLLLSMQVNVFSDDALAKILAADAHPDHQDALLQVTHSMMADTLSTERKGELFRQLLSPSRVEAACRHVRPCTVVADGISDDLHQALEAVGVAVQPRGFRLPLTDPGRAVRLELSGARGDFVRVSHTENGTYYGEDGGIRRTASGSLNLYVRTPKGWKLLRSSGWIS
jgi:hypothetical protein